VSDDVKEAVQSELSKIADKLQVEIDQLMAENKSVALARRFKRGPFNFGPDLERSALARVLNVVANALRRE